MSLAVAHVFTFRNAFTLTPRALPEREMGKVDHGNRLL
jgi:hypothetical protein